MPTHRPLPCPACPGQGVPSPRSPGRSCPWHKGAAGVRYRSGRQCQGLAGPRARLSRRGLNAMFPGGSHPATHSWGSSWPSPPAPCNVQRSGPTALPAGWQEGFQEGSTWQETQEQEQGSALLGHDPTASRGTAGLELELEQGRAGHVRPEEAHTRQSSRARGCFYMLGWALLPAGRCLWGEWGGERAAAKP